MTIPLDNAPVAPEAQEKADTVSQQNKSDANIPQSIAIVGGHNIAVQSVEPTIEKLEDPNWKAFREARKQDRIIREAAERKAAEKEAEVAALKAAMEAAFAKENPQQQRSNDYGYGSDETEDERIEKKVQAALAAREAESARIRQQREATEYPQRLRQNFSDFDQAISSENLDYLEFHYPEVARPLQRLGDGYEKWHDIYKAVKKFVPNNQTAKQESARADAN
ncbi:MAG TPA: hypothetical protein VN457_01610, partial [Chlamydiales bacterium]|nr:hypothetical protein [Chlamydiales bacterium]